MLLRFDPFRDLDRVFNGPQGWTPARSMPMDAYRHGDVYVIQFDIPGVDADSIDLTVDKNILSVKAERVRVEIEGDELIACERASGTFERQVYLSESLDREHLDARYENGVLTLHIPLLEQAKPRKVAVSIAETPKVLQATTS